MKMYFTTRNVARTMKANKGSRKVIDDRAVNGKWAVEFNKKSG